MISKLTAKNADTHVAVLHRVMAHRIIYGNECYTMHVATIYTDGSCTLEPFTCETPNTRFVNGTIKIDELILNEFNRKSALIKP